MSTRKITVTVELTVRDMTQAEWDEANEGAVRDDDDAEDDEDWFSGPDGWVASLEGTELNEPIELALDSVSNPEVFAGTGLFIHIENALVTEIVMEPVAQTTPSNDQQNEREQT